MAEPQFRTFLPPLFSLVSGPKLITNLLADIVVTVVLVLFFPVLDDEQLMKLVAMNIFPGASRGAAVSPEPPRAPARGADIRVLVSEDSLFSPDGSGLGQPESPIPPSIDDYFSVFHLNPKGIDTAAKFAAFDALVHDLDCPTLAAATETWLARDADFLTLSGYVRVSRLDRRVGRPGRGGIAFWVLESFAANIVNIGDSPTDERSWHVIHCDCGSVLFCLWYRPPNAGDIASILGFEQEFDTYSVDTTAFIAI